MRWRGRWGWWPDAGHCRSDGNPEIKGLPRRITQCSCVPAPRASADIAGTTDIKKDFTPSKINLRPTLAAGDHQLLAGTHRNRDRLNDHGGWLDVAITMGGLPPSRHSASAWQGIFPLPPLGDRWKDPPSPWIAHRHHAAGFDPPAFRGRSQADIPPACRAGWGSAELPAASVRRESAPSMRMNPAKGRFCGHGPDLPYPSEPGAGGGTGS